MAFYMAALLCVANPAQGPSATPAVQYFVSPSGSATGAGTSPGTAVATLEQARDLYRKNRRQSLLSSIGSIAMPDPAVVNVLPGVYSLSSALMLDSPLDSNVEWRGAIGATPSSPNKPVITGGLRISSDQFRYNNEVSAWEAPLPEGASVDDAGAAAYLGGRWMPPLHTQPMKSEQQSRFYIVYKDGDIPMAWDTSTYFKGLAASCVNLELLPTSCVHTFIPEIRQYTC